MYLAEATCEALALGGVRPRLFGRLETDPVARFHSGVGRFPMPADDVEDEDGAIYGGVALAGSLPVLESLINGEAGELVLSFNGLSAAMQAMGAGGAVEAEGCTAWLGVGYLDRRFQLTGPPRWVEAQIRRVNAPRRRGFRGINITIVYGATDRRLPPGGWLTDADQQARFPGDLGCARTSIYAAGSDDVWPRWT